MPAFNESKGVQNGGSQPAPRRLGIDINSLRLDMSMINRGLSSFLAEQRSVGIRIAADYAAGSGESDADISEDFSVYNCTDDDEDAQSVVHCAFCDFEFDISATRHRLEGVVGFQPKDMVCPVCDEKVGEDAWKRLLSQKPLKSSISSVGSSDSPRIYRRHASRVNKHETMSDSLWSQLISQFSLPSPSGIRPGEGFTSNASRISDAESSVTVTGAPSTGDELDHEERKLRASFVQQLVVSTLP